MKYKLTSLVGLLVIPVALTVASCGGIQKNSTVKSYGKVPFKTRIGNLFSGLLPNKNKSKSNNNQTTTNNIIDLENSTSEYESSFSNRTSIRHKNSESIDMNLTSLATEGESSSSFWKFGWLADWFKDKFNKPKSKKNDGPSWFKRTFGCFSFKRNHSTQSNENRLSLPLPKTTDHNFDVYSIYSPSSKSKSRTSSDIGNISSLNPYVLNQLNTSINTIDTTSQVKLPQTISLRSNTMENMEEVDFTVSKEMEETNE